MVKIHAVLLWLMMVALPLQGWAAVASMPCGTGHHQMATASSEQVDSDLGMTSVARHHANAAASSATAGAEEPGTPQSGSTSPKFKCGACTACCLMTALPAAALPVVAIAAATIVASIGPVSHAGFFTNGPERPPRHSLG